MRYDDTLVLRAILQSNLFIAEKLSTSLKDKKLIKEIGRGILYD